MLCVDIFTTYHNEQIRRCACKHTEQQQHDWLITIKTIHDAYNKLIFIANYTPIESQQ